MNPIYTFNKKELYYILAIFILGLIIGATLLNIYISHKIDYYILRNKILMDKLQNKQNNIDRLNKNLNKEKKQIIQEIELIVNSEFNDHTEQEIKKKLLDILESLIGIDIKKIDPLLIIRTIDNRFIKYEEKSYQIDLIYMVINRKTIISVKIK